MAKDKTSLPLKARLYEGLMRGLKLPALAGLVERLTQSPASRGLIRPFAHFYQVNQEEMAKDLAAYTSLSEFFARRLKEGARPVDSAEHMMVSPVDGVLQAFGSLNEAQAQPSHKGLYEGQPIDFSLAIKSIRYQYEELVGQPLDLSQGETFYYVIYLSPQNYHRMHAPIEGRYHLAGRLGNGSYPVNQSALKWIPNLYAKNYRLVYDVCSSQGLKGHFVAVGALNVNSIVDLLPDETKEATYLDRGQELAYFTLGSTVIAFFTLAEGWTYQQKAVCHQPIQMGQALCRLYPPSQ